MIFLLTLLGTVAVSGLPMNFAVDLEEALNNMEAGFRKSFSQSKDYLPVRESPAFSFEPQGTTVGAVRSTSDEDLNQMEAGQLKQATTHRISPAQTAATHLIQDELINNHFPSSQYKVLKYLGSGFSGKVFLVENSAGEKLALKIISLRYSKFTEAQSLQDVEREWRILNHPAVNQAFGEMTIDRLHNMRAYLPIKYIPGDTWESYLEGNSLTKEQNDKIMAAVMEKVNFIHSNGIIHGDVAARNIMLDPETLEPTLIDWQLAKESNDPSLRQNDYLGLKQELRSSWKYNW